MAAIAMLLLIAVVWNIVSISVGERIPEFAQLEALGWSRNTLSRLLFLEIYIVTFAGVLVSVPISQIFSLMFQGFMESFIPFYVPLFDLPSLLGVLLLTFVTTTVAVLPSVRRLRRIDVEKTIRERQMT
jgi:putative ABC transport system permease protein